ncbi:hypothetical protein DPMN_189269 [Dreissena polymorpha]|uniref:Uncharacterized protein n=1 Tax=Dreissena polymorpha TaxID=45954 RepID=A0A9D4DTT9_DREPO|nr:hypothetical protein DPMN_189269 [Dreissena polymorpha]
MVLNRVGKARVQGKKDHQSGMVTTNLCFKDWKSNQSTAGDQESVISENFGRKPATTPACSQTLEASDDSDADTSSYDDICQGRVRSMVNEVIGGNDDSESDDEDDNKDRPSLPPNESVFVVIVICVRKQ